MPLYKNVFNPAIEAEMSDEEALEVMLLVDWGIQAGYLVHLGAYTVIPTPLGQMLINDWLNDPQPPKPDDYKGSPWDHVAMILAMVQVERDAKGNNAGVA